MILAGDFNSAADGSTTDTYGLLTHFLDDAWSVDRGDPGFTCCQNSPLTNPVCNPGTRIDLILTRGEVRAVEAEVIGDAPFRRAFPAVAVGPRRRRRQAGSVD